MKFIGCQSGKLFYSVVSQTRLALNVVLNFQPTKGSMKTANLYEKQIKEALACDGTSYIFIINKFAVHSEALSNPLRVFNITQLFSNIASVYNTTFCISECYFCKTYHNSININFIFKLLRFPAPI